jgi:hypothetical protein
VDTITFIYPLFDWSANTWLHKLINDSNWLFPAVEAVHIVALCVLFGAILLLDLRLFGLTMRMRPVARMAKEFEPWIAVSLILLVTTGAALFAAEALRAYYNPPFWMKVSLLLVAVIFHYTVFRKVTSGSEEERSPFWGKVAAAGSLLLWLSIGAAGRAIAFY